jgi:hypothetical protein
METVDNPDVVETRSSALTNFATLPTYPYRTVPMELKNVNSGKCLGAVNAGTANGTQVAQFTCDGSKSQTWFFVHFANSNQFQIKVGHVGWRNLDVPGGSTANGLQMQIFGGDGSGDNQIFHVADAGSGNFQVRTNADKCLQIRGASTSSGAAVEQQTCTTGNNQLWLLRPRTTNYSLIAKHSGMCMDVVNASQSNNALVQQFQCGEGANNQRWNLMLAEVVSGTQYYTMVSVNSGKCLDVPNASTSVGVQLQQFGCNNGDNQKWSLADQGDGRVSIANKHSGLCIDVAGASGGNNASVQQYTCHGGDNQRWYYSGVIRRHVEVVQVAKTNGTNRTFASDSDVNRQLARVSAVYKALGIELVFDTNTDRVDINNDAIWNLSVCTPGKADGPCSTLFECSPGGILGTPWGCANSYAGSNHLGKVVIYMVPGGPGFSGGYLNWIRSMPINTGEACPGTGVQDDIHWSHEGGHYMGLSHPGPGDSDRLLDTRPDPVLGSCLSPLTSPGTDPNTGNPIDTDNVMSYYYNIAPRITVSQAQIVRATTYARWY